VSTLAVFFAIPMQSAGAATRVSLWVSNSGNDTTNCRTKSNPCATVTYALTQAPTTGTNINLLSDITESFQVTKDNVTVQSSPSTSHRAIRPNTATAAFGTPTTGTVRPIVYVGPSRSGIKLVNVSVDGADVPTAGGCEGGAGHTGVYVRSAQATLSRTDVVNVSQGPGLTGCQQGLAVYVRTDPSDASNVTITQGSVSNYDKNGITCNDSGTTCNITKTVVTGRGALPFGDAAQNGIQFGRGAKGVINGAIVSGHNYTPDGEGTGILLYDAGSGILVKNADLHDNNVNLYAINDGLSTGDTSSLTLTGNKVHDAALSADGNVGDGIVLDSINNATLSSNKAYGNPITGISGYGSVNNVIKGNQAGTAVTGGSANGDGILIAGDGSVNATSTGNFIASNKSSGNTGDGIHADAGTSSNVFGGNTMDANGGYEAHDESTGSGTAGTANTWNSNHCISGNDSPSGLCH
jgi:parallel beta-helix repeat protein